MAAHSDNSIRLHGLACKGKLQRKIVDKRNLGKRGERHVLFTCPGCSYVGRAGPYTPEMAARDKETAAKAKALAEAKAAPEVLEESAAPVAELNEAPRSKKK